jgi:hypothetical protein
MCIYIKLNSAATNFMNPEVWFGLLFWNQFQGRVNSLVWLDLILRFLNMKKKYYES